VRGGLPGVVRAIHSAIEGDTEMASTTKIRDFPEHLGNGVHNLSTNSIRIALSNTAPGSQGSNPTLDGNGILANVTQISYTNYTDDLTVDRVLQSVTAGANAGTWVFDAADFTITASGGALATFQYIYIYNDTPTSPADPLILCIDNGSPISLASGESVTVAFNASGIITIT
jgi:hypothetical protein